MIRIDIAGSTLFYESKEDLEKDVKELQAAVKAENFSYFKLHSENQFDDCSITFNADREENFWE